MDIPKVDFQELIKDLQRGETMQLVESDGDTPFKPITNPMKENLESVARQFEIFSFDLAPNNEVEKFVELLRFISKSIY